MSPPCGDWDILLSRHGIYREKQIWARSYVLIYFCYRGRICMENVESVKRMNLTRTSYLKEARMKNNTQKKLYHVIFPFTLSVIFFINAALPKTVLGCANRGLVALVIALISGLAAFVTVILALKQRSVGNSESIWWIISTLILLIPLIALIKLAWLNTF